MSERLRNNHPIFLYLLLLLLPLLIPVYHLVLLLLHLLLGRLVKLDDLRVIFKFGCISKVLHFISSSASDPSLILTLSFLHLQHYVKPTVHSQL